MVWVDYGILAIIGVSTLISLFRGFVKEAISLLGWIAAFWVALTFVDSAAVRLGPYLEPYLSAPALRTAGTFFGLFLAVLVVTAVVNFMAGVLVDKSGLSGTDRLLGMVFGAGRGALVIAGLVLLAGVTAIPQDPWWRESLFIGHFEAFAVEIRELLPPEIAEHLKF